LYDLDARGIVQDDIPFYLDYARQYGRDILEVACGTGRVTLPLARAGYHVTGFDLSEDMIGVLQDKLAQESPQTREKLNVFVADMTEYKTDKKYSLIIIPFRAFQLLTEDHQQKQFLEYVHAQLADDGIFIINTYRPYGKLDETWVQDETEDWIVHDPITNHKVRRTHIRRRIDVGKQVNYPELNYYVEHADGRIVKHVEKLAMKYYYEDQLRGLLQSHGFAIEAEFGYYDYRPIDQGPELIFVCKAKKSKY